MSAFLVFLAVMAAAAGVAGWMMFTVWAADRAFDRFGTIAGGMTAGVVAVVPFAAFAAFMVASR